MVRNASRSRKAFASRSHPAIRAGCSGTRARLLYSASHAISAATTNLSCFASRSRSTAPSPASQNTASLTCAGQPCPLRFKHLDPGANSMRHFPCAGLAMLLSLVAGQATAQEKLKIGVIVTLSGPAAALGQQVRDGFGLAVKDLGAKMGGRDVEVVVADDELKPDGAVTKVKGMLERDKVDFVVGPIFSNILQAIHKPVTDTKTFLISPNAGPSSYAGKNCSPFFYVTSYQNDQVHEVLGKVAQERGYKRMYLMVPNYQAGKDSVAGFKLDYKGEIVEESYMPLNTLDFQAELSKIASMKPDAVFTFMPGGMGVNLVKQYKQ